MTDLKAAWAAVRENTPEGWYVGRPGYEERYGQWSMHAFDPAEPAVDGKRSREWTTVGQTELRCLRSMAYCLGELKPGRWLFIGVIAPRGLDVPAGACRHGRMHTTTTKERPMAITTTREERRIENHERALAAYLEHHAAAVALARAAGTTESEALAASFGL